MSIRLLIETQRTDSNQRISFTDTNRSSSTAGLLSYSTLLSLCNITDISISKHPLDANTFVRP